MIVPSFSACSACSAAVFKVSSFSFVSLTASPRSLCFCASSSVFPGSSFRSLSTSFSWLCVFLISAVFGGHNSTSEAPGVYGLKYDKCYAASNTFTVTVKGKGCHGAYPGSGLDPIVVASQIVSALQTLSSRRVYATDSVIVTVGSFHAGTAGNIIPAEAVLKGTIRSFGPEMRKKMCGMFKDLVEGVARSMGAEADVTLIESYPGVVNHEGFSALL